MIRIAVIGAGRWGPNLLRNLHDRPRSEVTWVADVDTSRLSRIRAAYPDIQTTADLSAVTRDPAVDAVVVASPTRTHFAIAKEALLAGKHVLVEKPLTTSVAEGEALCELAGREKRILMVGHVFLYNAAVRRAREYLDEGSLGRLYYLSMTRTNLGPIRADVNAAWDLAAHDISIAHYWLSQAPVAVSAQGGSWINPGVEDAVFATLRYGDGVLANLHTSWLHPRKSREIAAIGERRMLTFDDMNLLEPLRLYDRQVTDERSSAGLVDSFGQFRASIREGDIVIPKVVNGEPLRAECEEFRACVETGRTPLSDGPLGVAVVRVLEAIQRSIKGGGREEAV